NSTAVSSTTQTLRGQCPVSCADSARGFLGMPLCHTECPLGTQQQTRPFRSHWCQWQIPLPRCVPLASVTMLQCEREGADRSSAGLGGQCPPRQDTQRDS
ncbi:hypothetical protein TcCL_NonESM08632, partial [Trypanosoma cruzi]